MRKVLFLFILTIGIFSAQAEDKFAGFSKFFTPVKEWVQGGTWLFKPTVTVSVTAFDKHGNPFPFSGTGAGISFQREISIGNVTKTTFEVDADWLAFNAADVLGSGPALLVGAFNGLCVGGSYDVKGKRWLALLNYSGTLFK